ncbi:endonuclease/exonuclease/phosphatase family protein [Nocardioides sp. NPDC057764]|uniref:endonuclease/exonuclease/phosphatase family protein n=1 Tax=Nocardioides sp. NPDC057764 TaxID=3346243 RepID=UPI003672B990
MSFKAKVAAITGVVTVIGITAVMIPVVFFSVLGSSGAAACMPGASITYSGPPVKGLTATQMQRAVAIVDEGYRLGVPERGIMIALAVASQESGFRVYANDGEGGDLEPDQKGIEASLRLEHDAVGTDHGSLGVFQQQWPWWGTMPELMDPATSARKFFEALGKVSGWESLPVTVAAQRVQRSAYPDAYADDEPLARGLLEAIARDGGRQEVDEDSSDGAEDPAAGGMDGANQQPGATAGGPEGMDVEVINGVYVGSPAGAGDCVTPARSDALRAVAFPLPANSGYVNQNNFGSSGSSWANKHTGNDYSVGCGAPVLAATAGTVELDSSQTSWAGPNFVRISTKGPGSLATWYAHMETKTVRDGQRVTPGQQIGTVGNLGNSKGCHLHFEVHPNGGRIYEDPIDPVKWLATNLSKTTDSKTTDPATGGEEASEEEPAIEAPTKGAKSKPGNPAGADEDPAAPPAGADTVTVLSYNIKHASLARRDGGGVAALAEEITSSGADVIALQEADNVAGRTTGTAEEQRDQVAANVYELARSLGMQFAYSVTGDWRGRPVIDNAILSRYPIIDADHTKLPGGIDIQPRGLLRVSLDTTTAGVIDVYASHLHYTGNIRVTQAQAVQRAIGDPDCGTVLMGDMNTTPNSTAYRALAKNLRDPFAGGRHGAGHTAPATNPRSRIDYVLHDPASTVVDAQVMPEGASDHRGVRTTFKTNGDCS